MLIHSTYQTCVLSEILIHAIRSHTVDTQLVTFKMLIAVITRYPGIRRLFYHPKDSGQAISSFEKHWTREHQPCGNSWIFYRDYTLHCLSDNEITALVEKELPSKLGHLELLEDDWNKTPIESLLSFCRPVLRFTRACALFSYLTFFKLNPGVQLYQTQCRSLSRRHIGTANLLGEGS